jgi:hypothetical protein
MTHPTEYMITCCGRPAPIDVELAPICRAIWAYGIHTQWTCQGDGDGNATIAFPDIGEADRFGQLLFDFDRLHDMRQQQLIPLPDRIPAADWKITTLFRFPLPQRATMNVHIPRADLPWLAEWLAGAPHRQLQTPPVAEPCEVSPDAGKASSEEYATFYGEFEDAMEVLNGLDDGKCFCEPGEIDHEAGCGIDDGGECDCDPGPPLEHDADCPHSYDHLSTAEDIAAFRKVLTDWAAHGSPEVARLTRIGLMARAIELERAASA